jgi:hypothetical protein
MGALVDRELCSVFGEDRVFRDCRSMAPGVYFPEEIERRLFQSTVLLALIGEKWLTLTDAVGNPRVQNPDDFVRWEIRVSLERRIAVIPVLVDDANLPSAATLPDDIRRLAEQQYVRVRTRYDQQDIAGLVEALKEHVPARAADGRATADRPASPQFNFYEQVRADVIGISYNER